ncbi:glutathione S-transferase N-terminal domain-containing protein [uncultured Deefgea sp.]|uniref:glutathione S-transferase N-terminal domain-containing protein n=1 Tax=uncultured Deefgea sp. TaxID=1304914 RepID=UPI00260A749C|nr:glutathione S-transferase N-terminal domain-containing protein [uncultured Deefgea sp.]
MKLITALHSPFGRKIRIVLAEKKIDFELIIAKPGEDDALIQSYNPLGKVPVLALDDGRVIYDSSVIAEHLDYLSPVCKLFPSDQRPMISAKRTAALADGICDAAVAIVLEQRRPSALQSHDAINRQQDKIKRGLSALASQLEEKRWFSGDAYSIADIAVICMLEYLDLRLPQLQWATHYPALQQYHLRVGERAAMVETRPVAMTSLA